MGSKGLRVCWLRLTHEHLASRMLLQEERATFAKIAQRCLDCPALTRSLLPGCTRPHCHPLCHHLLLHRVFHHYHHHRSLHRANHLIYRRQKCLCTRTSLRQLENGEQTHSSRRFATANGETVRALGPSTTNATARAHLSQSCA